MSVIREAAVAGQFYPGSAGELNTTVEQYHDEAPAEAGPRPKALMVPHAGYIYSGPLELAQHRGMMVETLDLRNSADTAGQMAQVVGYDSWMFVD